MSNTSQLNDAAQRLLAGSSPDANLQTNRDILLDRIETWLVTDSLHDISLRLLALYSYDKALLSGSLLALFAKRLLTAELVVGGPYDDKRDKNMLETNVMIARLFRAFGTPLNKVEAYIKQQGVDLSIHTTPPGSAKPSPPLSVAARAIKHELDMLPMAIAPFAVDIWRKIADADTRHEIAELNSTFAAALYHGSPEIAARFDIATYYAWMAYTIYDNIIDDETDPHYLGVANIAHRASLRAFESAITTGVDTQMPIKYFDMIDCANAWELAHCRFYHTDTTLTIKKLPAYRSKRMLYERACLYALGPLLQASLVSNRHELKLIRDGLKHYIIARQLNDDLHDWKEDLANGHCSYVVAFLLRHARIRPGEHAIDALIERLQQYFWHRGLEQLTSIILDHVTMARSAFESSTILQHPALFFDLTINPIYESAVRAKHIRADQQSFLDSYSD